MSMAGLGRKVGVVVTAGLLSVSMALSPVTVGLSALSPSVALAGTAVAEGNHGTRVVGWHESPTEISMIVHIKIEGLDDSAVMPTKAVDLYGNEFEFDNTGEAVFQIAVLTDAETGDCGCIVLPASENVDDWRFYFDSTGGSFKHRVNGSWVSVEADEVQLLKGYDTDFVKFCIDGDYDWTQHLYTYAPPYNFFYDDVRLSGINTPNDFWKIEYSDGLSFNAFAKSWSGDSRNLATIEYGKAVFPVPNPFLYESDVSDPYAGFQTGSGQMSLRMIMQDTREHSGTAVDPSNPDDDNDGLGDNLAFTVPSVVNYVVKPDGQLLGPSEGVAYIENRSAFATHVSAMDVDPETGFNFVADASASNAANSVDLQLGPAADMLQASEYLDKKSVNDASAWGMTSAGSAPEKAYTFESNSDWLNTSSSKWDGFDNGKSGNIVDPVVYVMERGSWPDGVVVSVRNGSLYVPISLGEVTVDNTTYSTTANVYANGIKVGSLRLFTNAETGDSVLLREDGLPDLYLGLQSKLPLKTEGDVSHISKDITSSTQFGTVKWYVTPGEVS